MAYTFYTHERERRRRDKTVPRVLNRYTFRQGEVSKKLPFLFSHQSPLQFKRPKMFKKSKNFLKQASNAAEAVGDAAEAVEDAAEKLEDAVEEIEVEYFDHILTSNSVTAH